MKDGIVTLPNKPGLGVEIDWDALEKYRLGGDAGLYPGKNGKSQFFLF